MTLGTQPELLILGWLRNQRLVTTIDQVKAIQVDWEMIRRRSRLTGIEGLEQRLSRKTITTGCGRVRYSAV